MGRSSAAAIASVLLLVVLLSCLPDPIFAAAAGSADGYTIAGRIKPDSLAAKGFAHSSKLSETKVILNGGQKVRVDISARHPGKIQAALTENRRTLSELVLEPMKEEQYYEIREPFSVMSFFKSPMGLMIGFMVLVMFVFPKMMDGIDPEEMRQAQEQMRQQGIPSLSNLVAGRS